MKNICVITGASSGIGKEFFAQITKDPQLKFDEFWVVARNEGRLKALETECPVPLKVIPLDLSSEESFAVYRSHLEAERPISLFWYTARASESLNRRKRWATRPI